MARLMEKMMLVAPERIGFMRFILEAYDNLAMLTTIDEKEGAVVLRYSAELAREVEELLAALPHEISAREVGPDE